MIIADEMERIVMREDAEKHYEPWRMTRFPSVFFGRIVSCFQMAFFRHHGNTV